MDRSSFLLFGVAASLVCGVVHADAVKPLPADGRLVYVRQVVQGCDLRLWDSRESSERILTTVPECPKGMDVTSSSQALVLLDRADIRVFKILEGKLGPRIALPQMDPPKGGGDVGSAQAGYTPDGRMALEMVADHPDDSQDMFLFIRNGDAWTQVEHVACGRFGPDCEFKQKFDSHPLGGPSSANDPSQIWNDALRGDPYVLKRVPETSETYSSDFDGINTLVFRVDGHDSKLAFYEEAGEDTGMTGTFRLNLTTPDGRRLDITDEQFDATVVGHYLLFYGYSDEGTRLYDVANGALVLDKLRSAGWLDD